MDYAVGTLVTEKSTGYIGIVVGRESGVWVNPKITVAWCGYGPMLVLHIDSLWGSLVKVLANA